MLNRDCQEFHQYQQNKQSPLAFTHRTHKKKTMTYDVENSDPDMGQAQKCGRVKNLNW